MDPKKDKPNPADKADVTVKAIRTFESDIAEVLKHNNVTMASMAIAENVREQKNSGGQTYKINDTEHVGQKISAPRINTENQTPAKPLYQSKSIDLEVRLRDAFNNPFEKPTPSIDSSANSSANSKIDSSPKPEIIKPKKEYTEKPLPVIEKIQTPQTQYASIIRNNPAPSNLGRNFVLLIGSALLIAGGLYGGYYFYSQSPLAPITQTDSTIMGLIMHDAYTLSTLSKQNRDGIIQAFKDARNKALQGNHTIIETFIVEQIPDTTQSQALSTTKFFEYTKSKIPSILLRSISPRFVVGHHKVGNDAYPFLVFQSQYFQNSFAGMIKWEPFMYEDLSFMVRAPEFTPRAINLPSSYATSTTATSTEISTSTLQTEIYATSSIVIGGSVTSAIYKPQIKFTDKLRNNRDIRVMTDENDNHLLFYSFITKDLIAITTLESTLVELIQREDRKALLR